MRENDGKHLPQFYEAESHELAAEQMHREGDIENYDEIDKLKFELKIARKTIECLSQENDALKKELEDNNLKMYNLFKLLQYNSLNLFFFRY